MVAIIDNPASVSTEPRIKTTEMEISLAIEKVSYLFFDFDFVVMPELNREVGILFLFCHDDSHSARQEKPLSNHVLWDYWNIPQMVAKSTIRPIIATK